MTLDKSKFDLKMVDEAWLRQNMRCQNVCATHTDVPGYLALTAMGRFEEAYDLIRETNPFPSICGRVCHHPCETHCRRAEIDAPVAIDALKRFVADYVVKKGKQIPVPKPAKERREKVAVIGSGPVGLTAAHDLARLGYKVNVFESQPVAGGMLVLGIPEYRLPRNIIRFEIEHIKAHGVNIMTDTAVGRDISFKQLLKDYQAVLISAGAQKSVRLGIPGEDGEGYIDCLEFLRKANLLKDRKPPGKRVVVIGGGNSAIDAARVSMRLMPSEESMESLDSARMALRLGAEKLVIVYRRSKSEMTASEQEVAEAQEEGVKIQYLTAPVEVLRTNDNKLAGVRCVRMKLGQPDSSGRRRPVPIKGSEFLIQADCVIPAIGQCPDVSFLPEDSGIDMLKWGFVVADQSSFQTTRSGVFAAGDVVTGPKTVIDAIAAGHGAAESIHGYLSGEKGGIPHVHGSMVELTPVEKIHMARDYDSIRRQNMPKLPVGKRMGVFDEIELGFTEEMAMREAQRCLRCNINICIQSKDCIACGRCSEICPTGCIQMVTKEGKDNYAFKPWMEGEARVKDESLCIHCGLCKDYCPVESISYSRVKWKKSMLREKEDAGK